ncbi:MAG: hypothetical protein Q4D29_03555 [Lachnospiraceae bacterium]|nr:hypothetical protein [Lachnospiraceae bacterium]
MDGFRDRMNRGASERGSYDRHERSARRSSYSAPAAGVSADEIAQLVDESNGKQLEVINDLFEDAKDDRFESEKQILAAIDDLIACVNNKEAAPVEQQQPSYEEETATEEINPATEEILRTVNSNADLLAQFAEEQLPMLVRGNSSILNQIREALSEQEDALRRISEEIARNASQAPQDTYSSSTGNEEILNAATTNNALLNALRSDVAGLQAEMRSQSERLSAKADEENTPLDDEDVLTKAKAEEWYKSLDETIHADCVKVYRNVQKLFEEKNTGSEGDVTKSIGGLKVLAIINLVLLLLNLVAVLANVLGFIG